MATAWKKQREREKKNNKRSEVRVVAKAPLAALLSAEKACVRYLFSYFGPLRHSLPYT